MRKYIIGFFVGVTVASTATAFADDGLQKIEAYLRPDLPITLNGEKANLDSPAVVVDGSTYLKLRDVAKLTNVQVNWNQETQTVEMSTYTNVQVSPSKSSSALTPNSSSAPNSDDSTYEKNSYDSIKNKDALIEIHNGTTYIVFRNGVDKYGLYHSVSYNNDDKTIAFKSGTVVKVSDEYSDDCDAYFSNGRILINESILLSESAK